jgi:hypothetical protein
MPKHELLQRKTKTKFNQWIWDFLVFGEKQEGAETEMEFLEKKLESKIC